MKRERQREGSDRPFGNRWAIKYCQDAMLSPGFSPPERLLVYYGPFEIDPACLFLTRLSLLALVKSKIWQKMNKS